MHVLPQETLLLEGQFGGGAAAFLGLRMGGCGHARVRKQDIDILLHRLQLRN